MNRIICQVRWLPLWVGVFLALPTQATHFQGLDMSYTCLDSCNYRFTVTNYWDCSGTVGQTHIPLDPNDIPDQPEIDFYGIGSNCSAPVPAGDWEVDTGYGITDVTPVCPTAQTRCDQRGSTNPINGVFAFRYTRIYSFCNATCERYTAEFDECCRNDALTSVPNNTGMNVAITVDLTTDPCNNSPRFTNVPTPYLCLGQPFIFNQGAFDPDGDSLAYRLGECFDDRLGNPGFPAPAPVVDYEAGFSPTAPLGSAWDVSVNPQTGDVSIIPNGGGSEEVGLLCLYVEEWRNGVQIGESVRDIQITVLNCAAISGQTNSVPSIDTIIANTPGTSVNFVNNVYEITTCACDEMCLNIPVEDSDIGQDYVITWNKNLPNGALSDPLNPFNTGDTLNFTNGAPTFQFCWVPLETGRYLTTFNAQDNGCPILGQTQITLIINVVGCQIQPVPTPRRIGCFDMLLTGLPCGGQPPFTFEWTGTGGLNVQGDSVVFTYPGPGVYPYTLTISDSNGTSASTIDTIFLDNDAMADAGPDLAICSNEVTTIGTPALPGYTYQWTSPFGQGWNGTVNPTVAQPEIVFVNGTNNPVTIPYYVEAFTSLGCVARDTVLVTFDPAVPANFVAGTPVCIGVPTQVIYAAPPIPGATYNWDYDGGIGTANGPGPHNVFWNTAGTKNVSLVVETGTCPSDTAIIPVVVQPLPSSDFSLPASICVGDPALIQYLGGSREPSASFEWTIGGGGQGATSDSSFNLVWSTPGLKTISLKVIDNTCESTVTTRVIEVIPIPEASFFTQDSACVDDEILITYTGTAGPNATYTWNFSGGTVLSGSGPGPYRVRWTTAGSKNISLQVSDQGCSSGIFNKVVDINARAALLITPVADQCFIGNEFNFTATGLADSYQWIFGASAVPAFSEDPVPPAVSFQTTGLKTIFLVGANSGCLGDTASLSFEVIEEPSANFLASTSSTCDIEPVTYTYQGTVLGPQQTFSWDFGRDAVPATWSDQTPPPILYNSPGVKSVTLTVTYKGCVTETTQLINVTGGPVADAGDPKEFCEGDGGVELEASVSGGTLPYFYQWTCDDPPNCGIDSVNVEDPKVNPDVTNPTEEVVYYFQVTDVNGCISPIDSVVVTVKAKPKLDAGPDTTICPGLAFGHQMQGRPADNNRAPEPFAYNWSPAAGLSDPNNPIAYARGDTTTIYTLVASSVNGCSSVATTTDPASTVEIAVKKAPSAFAGPDTGVCVGGSVTLQGFASGAGPDYTYSWTPADPGTIVGANTPNPVVTPPRTTFYTLSVTSNGCSGADTVLVVVDTKPTISAGNDRDLCQLDSLQLSAIASGDPDATQYRYEWTPTTGLSDPNVAKPIATPDATTQYTVRATTEFGCASDLDDVILTVLPTPIVTLNQADTVLCGGDELELNASHTFNGPSDPVVDYSWQPEDFVTTTADQQTVIASPPVPTAIIVTASTVNGRCSTSDQVFLQVNPAVVAAIDADTNRICAGESVALTATGGQGNAAFDWFPTAGLSDPTGANPVATPDTTTTYEVFISEGVCNDVASFTIVVNPNPIPDYFSSLTEGCDSLTVSFMENAMGEITAYAWDFGDGSPLTNEANPVHTYLSPGIYPVTLTTTTPGGCERSLTKTTITINASPVVSASANPEGGARIPLPDAMVSFTDNSQGAVSYFWEFGDGNASSEQNPTHTYTTEGTYTVTLTVTDSAGCESQQTFGPFIIFEPTIFIPNIFTPNGDGLNDSFLVSYDGKEAIEMTVTDRWGRKVYETSEANAGWDGTETSGGEVGEGVYFYSITIGGESFKGTLTLLR